MLYEDNTEKEVCGYEISGFDNMKVEPQTVTVIYKGYDNLCYNYKKLKKTLIYQRCCDNMIIEKGASDRRLALYFAKIAA